MLLLVKFVNLRTKMMSRTSHDKIWGSFLLYVLDIVHWSSYGWLKFYYVQNGSVLRVKTQGKNVFWLWIILDIFICDKRELIGKVNV